MRHRHPSRLPRLWLMTDERMGDALWDAIRRLPRGSGIVFRHYDLDRAARVVLLGRVARAARRGGHWLTVGGIDHGRHRGAVTAPVHSLRERIAAERAGVRALFVSPVFATRSHPGARPLGRCRFGLIVRGAKVPVIALGGMDRRRFLGLRAFGIHGWAAIDALAKRLP
jgi:thiamine-phosphate pyrophosphorylase